MRKQYRFWPSNRGLMAWDVQRLFDLSRELPRIRIRLQSISELDQVYWFDDEEEKPTCRKVLEHIQLINDVNLDHPIMLGADGRVMDGMHRVAKAVLKGLEEIEAVRFDSDPHPITSAASPVNCRTDLAV